MLLPLALLQLSAATHSEWRPVERTTVAWKPAAAPYEVLVEQGVPTSPSEDPAYRIRVRVPGRPDFSVVDERGGGGFFTVREALGTGDVGLVPRTLPDSTHLLVVPAAGFAAPLLVAFGWAFASDPNELVVLTLDDTGYPTLLFRDDLHLTAVADLDGDGRAELVGKPALSEQVGDCATTYVPYAVYRLDAAPGAKPRYDVTLSQKYNVAHYVWAGPTGNENFEVRGCAPGNRHVVDRHRR